MCHRLIASWVYLNDTLMENGTVQGPLLAYILYISGELQSLVATPSSEKAEK